jgi:TRAP-type C4-dicarboxylate transport system permease small subunit
MFPTPFELKVLFWICVALGLWLAWVVRRDHAELPLLPRIWRNFENSITVFLMLLMLGASTVQVLARYVLPEDITLPWTEEAGRLFMVWATLWAAAVVQRTDEHITMTAVFDLLPAGAQRALLVFCDLLTIALLAPVTWWGWNNARTLDIMQSISLGLPLSIFAYSIPVTAGLMIVFSLGLVARRFSATPIRSGGGAVEI